MGFWHLYMGIEGGGGSVQVAIVTTRLTLIGTSNKRLAVAGTSQKRLTIEGASR